MAAATGGRELARDADGAGTAVVPAPDIRGVVWEGAARMTDMTRPSTNVPFIARQAERDLIADALERARAGEPGVVLVGADAGVGKTRLLSRGGADATETGALVVLSHCVDLGEVGLPYLPFTEALVELRSSRQRTEAAVVARPVLARFLDPGAGPLGTDEESQTERLQLFEGIAAVLAEAGTPEAPLVLMIEDLHWADPSSRDLLRFLVARLRRENLLVVATYRADDLHRRHPLRPLLAELHRHPRVTHVDLRPFDTGELRAFTTAVAGHPLDEESFEVVRARSEGNAYFAEELVESDLDDGALPGSLAEVLRSRLELLDPCVQDLARLASVAGRVVKDSVLREVAQQSGIELSGFDLGRRGFDVVLREAVAHQVLGVEGEWIVFRHALLAEVVHADLLPGEQASVHRAYLQSLLDHPELGSPAVVAHHALRAHDLPRALVASREAARKAARVLAPAEELRHLEQVLSLWKAVPDVESLLGEDRIEVVVAAASAASRAGEQERAVALARKAVEATADDPVRQASLRTVLARYLLEAERLQEVLEQTQAALAVLPESPATLQRARTLAMHARAALNNQLPELARKTADAAVAEARQVGAQDVEADVLTTMAVLERDDLERSLELVHAARGRARESGDLLTELRCWHNLAVIRYETGDLTAAQTVLRDGLERALANGLGWSIYGVEMRLFSELVRFALGDLTPPDPAAEPAPSSHATALSSVELYGAAARGDSDVLERVAALRRAAPRDVYVTYVTSGIMTEALTEQGRYDEAITLTPRAVACASSAWGEDFAGRIWLSAVTLRALADAAEQERVHGADVTARVALGEQELAAAEHAAVHNKARGGRLGPRAWRGCAAAGPSTRA